MLAVPSASFSKTQVKTGPVAVSKRGSEIKSKGSIPKSSVQKRSQQDKKGLTLQTVEEPTASLKSVLSSLNPTHVGLGLAVVCVMSALLSEDPAANIRKKRFVSLTRDIDESLIPTQKSHRTSAVETNTVSPPLSPSRGRVVPPSPPIRPDQSSKRLTVGNSDKSEVKEEATPLKKPIRQSLGDLSAKQAKPIAVPAPASPPPVTESGRATADGGELEDEDDWLKMPSPLPIPSPNTQVSKQLQPESVSRPPIIPTERTPPIPAPAPKKQSGNILSRLFQKPGGGREADLEKLLSAEDSARPLRIAVASLLARIVSIYLFPQLAKGGSLHDSSVSDVPPGGEVVFLEGLAADCSLSREQSAEAFAEVTGAMLTTMVDAAAVAMDRGDEAEVVDNLDTVSSFVATAGDLFGRLYEGVAVEPVQYSGRTKKGTVDNMYCAYLKSLLTHEIQKSMELMSQLQPSAEASAAAEPEETDEDRKIAQRRDRAEPLARALAIKEGRRSSLEQRANKEVLASSGLGAAGAAPGIGDLFGALTGKGKGFEPDMKAVQDMMGGAPGSGTGAGDNPFAGMSQEQIMEYTKESMRELRQMIREGSMTRDMVVDMERSMKIDFSHFAKLLEGPAARQNLKDLPPDVADMMEVFKELSRIKNS